MATATVRGNRQIPIRWPSREHVVARGRREAPIRRRRRSWPRPQPGRQPPTPRRRRATAGGTTARRDAGVAGRTAARLGRADGRVKAHPRSRAVRPRDREPPLAILLQAAPQQAANRGRRVAAARPVRLALEHAASVSDTSSPSNARRREHFVEHAAERPDVGALVDRLAARLLRRHVGGRAEDHARLRHRGVVIVGDLDIAGDAPARAPSPSRDRSRAPSRCRPAAP